VEDIGEFAKDVFGRESIGEETKANSIRWFKTLFARGNSLELALGSRYEF
jgi:hypothetical protein